MGNEEKQHMVGLDLSPHIGVVLAQTAVFMATVWVFRVFFLKPYIQLLEARSLVLKSLEVELVELKETAMRLTEEYRVSYAVALKHIEQEVQAVRQQGMEGIQSMLWQADEQVKQSLEEYRRDLTVVLEKETEEVLAAVPSLVEDFCGRLRA